MPESLSEILYQRVVEAIKLDLDRMERKPEMEEKYLAVIKRLTNYFTGKKMGGRGIFLYGSVGAGKTLLFSNLVKVLRKNFNSNIQIVNCQQIVADYCTGGYDALNRYIKAERNPYNYNRFDNDNGVFKTEFILDDLGVEGKAQYYGVKKNVIAEIIMMRYINFQRYGFITHATSNIGYDGGEIEQLYGKLVRSRMREMFEFIELPGNDKRK